MSNTSLKADRLPFDAGWKHALLEYRQTAFWYAVVVFLNLCAFAAVFSSTVSILKGDIFPWVLTIAIAFVGFLASFSQDRKLKIPRVYLGYVALAGSIQLVYWLIWPSAGYLALFWIAELLHNILLSLVSLEIVTTLLPSRYLKFWGIVALSILLLRFATAAMTALFDISTSASFICGCLLSLLFFMRVKWTREQKVVTAGIVTLLFSSFVQSFVTGGRALLTLSRITLLIGLALLAAAGSSKQKVDS